jgi:hypothetical protein
MNSSRKSGLALAVLFLIVLAVPQTIFVTKRAPIKPITVSADDPDPTPDPMPEPFSSSVAF